MIVQEILSDIESRFSQRTPLSKDHDTKAKRRLPGGDTRSATYFAPHPAYMEWGQGCRLYDADGNEYIDFLNNYTSLIHGHSHPKVIDAARAQLEKGTVFGSAAEIQYLHAEHICQRIPSLEQIRFGNSGTEGTLFTMKAARAFTKKELFIKMDGGYHSSHDYIEVNVIPGGTGQGLPPTHVEPGAPAGILRDMLVAAFNDLEAVETLLEKNKGKVAAILVEPMIGALGMIPPQPGYLQGLRKLADQYQALLIFDEVISFRLSTGGLQDIEGVSPDLTALGKIIGGGFPVGAFGGRADIMSLFAPSHPESIFHSGTFNGCSVTMAAGLATMELYDAAAADRINALGQRLRDGFNAAFKRTGVIGQATGLGSLTQVHWRAGEITSAAHTMKGLFVAGELPRLLHMEMMNQGIYSATRGMFIVSTPMTEQEIDRAVEVFEGVLEMLLPYIKEELPHLVAS